MEEQNQPNSQNPIVQDSIEDVYQVARFQKYLIWLVVANLAVAILFRGPSIISLITSVGTMFFIYEISKGLKLKYIALWLIGMLIPLLNLILLLVVNGKATAFIRRNGFSVGFMGANVPEIKAKLDQQKPISNTGV